MDVPCKNSFRKYQLPPFLRQFSDFPIPDLQYLDGAYAKLDQDSNLPWIELNNNNGVKFDGSYKNIELDKPREEWFDKNEKRLDGTYKKALSDKLVNETYDDGKKLDGMNIYGIRYSRNRCLC